jgi:exopolysaccharide biosynthesis polyprenyl glycosylphosphotransferase
VNVQHPDFHTPGSTRGAKPLVQNQPSGMTAVSAPNDLSSQLLTGLSRRLVRLGASPYLLITDAAALVLATVFLEMAWVASITFVVAGLAAMGAIGMYRGKLHRSALDDLPWILAAAFIAASGSFLIASRFGEHSLWMLFLSGVSGGMCVSAGRFVAYELIRRGRLSGHLRHRSIVLGAGEVGVRLIESMRRYPTYGLDPVGFLDASPPDDRDSLPAPLLGSWTELERIVRQYRIKRVVVAFTTLKEAELVNVLRAGERLNCTIYYVPRLFELHHMTGVTDDVRGIPLMQVRSPTLTRFAWYLKRVFDVVVGGALLVLTAPIQALCAAAVALEGGRGVIFRQERIGRDGRPFEMLKFRSLCPQTETAAATTWTVKDDPRMGPVGKFLRRTSLDELPQLYNVVRGDMSLVGPRPERPHFASHFGASIPRYSERHRVPVGITGWAQINGLRGDTSIDERAQFDNYYIENWSLWFDTKILLRTALRVLARSGE